MRLKEKISNALATSDNTNEYANPIFPNKLPRVKIPITSISIETILVITIYPLFSRARNFETYNVYTVVGIIEIETTGISSTASMYSGNIVGIISGAMNIPINANMTENITVRILILLEMQRI